MSTTNSKAREVAEQILAKYGIGTEDSSIRGDALRDDIAAAIEQAVGEAFQARVKPWLIECFGEQIANDATERNHRFLEEALEVVQACGKASQFATVAEVSMLKRHAKAVIEKWGGKCGGERPAMSELCVHCDQPLYEHFFLSGDYLNACPNGDRWHPTNRFTPRTDAMQYPCSRCRGGVTETDGGLCGYCTADDMNKARRGESTNPPTVQPAVEAAALCKHGRRVGHDYVCLDCSEEAWSRPDRQTFGERTAMTPEQQRKLRTLAAGMVAAASAYKEFAAGWKGKPVRDPFKSTRVKDFERAAEAGKELVKELCK